MSESRTTIDLAAVKEIVDRFGRKPEAAIPILQALQSAYRYLPREAMERVCELTDISPAQLTGVSTFYSQFRHRGLGRHLIQVCHGTACHVAGAERISEAFQRHFDFAPGQDTSSDGMFTLEPVACLGCCSLAPVMKIDGQVYGHLTPARAIDCLGRFLRDEAAGVHQRKRQDRAVLEGLQGALARPETVIRVGLNSCCIASGSLAVCESLQKAVSATGANAVVKPVGCTGMCHSVPLVEIAGADGRSALFGDNNAKTAEAIVRRNIRPRGLFRKARRAFEDTFDFFLGDDDWHKERAVPIDQDSGPAADFLDPQVRIVTEHCGELAPLDIDEYIAFEGYQALKKCVESNDPERTIELIAKSGLRGRGGAGFPTGKKWSLVREAGGQRKFVICNGDEGDPGAFMDRMLLEAYPHRILEGLAIAAFSVGAEEGYFYIRAEYALANQRIEKAIEQAEERGFLGENIFGSGVNLRLRIMKGAGAFVCGEETALLASIEGQRGMPRLRPPYPAEKGLWDCPTSVNNVETYACVPWIIRNGSGAFAALGTEHSKGTKVFALAGRVARGGLIEVPMGTTVWEIVQKIGGGVREGRRFKAVQLGGPSGGCIPAQLGDTPIDYEAVARTGAIMGSGGLVVMDDTTCMVDVARYFLEFTQKESCGRCTFCRIGTKRMLEILERLCKGDGRMKDLDDLEDLAAQVKGGSLCGLGKTAPNPILTTLRHFRGEYEAHVNGRCPAGKCATLVRYEIDDKCIGCTLCAQDCPTDAILPKPYEIHVVDDEKCVRCGACIAICPQDAVSIVPRINGARQEVGAS